MQDWPADRVERWGLDRLVPYARNARTHSDAQVAQIAASVREWGWTVPVLVDETGMLIAGHGRVLAARKLSRIPLVTVHLVGARMGVAEGEADHGWSASGCDDGGR